MEGKDINKLLDNGSSSPSTIKFEVVLRPPKPKAIPPVLVASPVHAVSPVSKELIQEKLKAAAERRKSQEFDIIARQREKDEKIKLVRKQKSENIEILQNVFDEKLKQKIQTSEEIQAAMLKTKLDKLREKEKHAEEVRKSLEEAVKIKAQQTEEKLTQKIQIVEENREANLNEKVANVQAKLKKIEESKFNQAKQAEIESQMLDEKVAKKLVIAEMNRESGLKKIVQKCKEHDSYCEEVLSRKREQELKG